MLPFELADDEAVSLYLAAEKSLKENDLFTAIRLINGAIKLNDQVPEYFLLKSRIEQAGNKHKKALKTVNRAVKLVPNSPDVYYARAVCKFTAKDFIGATQDFSRVIAMDPGHYLSFYGRG